MAISVGVIGAGISGLAVAHHLKRIFEASGRAFELTLYEKSDRVGGSIRSERTKGFLVEWGPNGFLNNEPATFQLIQQLGIRDRLVVSSDAARKRFLLLDGQLQQVPTSPSGFLKTPILPLHAKLRFALEPMIRRRDGAQDESVAEFVARRFGAQAVARMFDPLMSGVYAGNVNTLSIHSTLKVFAELEREHGSVVKGMIARMKQRKAEERQGAQEKVDELVTTSRNPMSGKLLSFQNGMGELIEALAVRLEAHTLTNATIESIHGVDGGYEVTGQVAGGPLSRRHDALIMASPPQAGALLVAPLDLELGQLLAAIQSSTIAVLGLGFTQDGIADPLDGFGYLIPRNQGLRSLGVLWSSSIFPNRAPNGHKLLQVMIGGANDPGAINEDDSILIDTALKNADPVLHFKSEPIMTRVFRHRCGIPQYNLGHRERLQSIAQRLQHLPGFYLAGNGYHGISTNDCLRHAAELAERIVGAHPCV